MAEQRNARAALIAAHRVERSDGARRMRQQVGGAGSFRSSAMVLPGVRATPKAGRTDLEVRALQSGMPCNGAAGSAPTV